MSVAVQNGSIAVGGYAKGTQDQNAKFCEPA